MLTQAAPGTSSFAGLKFTSKLIVIVDLFQSESLSVSNGKPRHIRDVQKMPISRVELETLAWPVNLISTMLYQLSYTGMDMTLENVQHSVSIKC
jgi:hypothetical protein